MNVDIKTILPAASVLIAIGVAWGQTQKQIEQVEQGVIENKEVFKLIEVLQREMMQQKFEQQRKQDLLEQKIDLLLQRTQ